MAGENGPQVIPMLTYEDGPAIMDWLVSAFGFREITRMLDKDGLLAHGELAAGNGRIMVSAATPYYESPRRHQEHCERARAWSAAPWVIDGVLVYVDDVDAHFAQAKAADAKILTEVEDGWPDADTGRKTWKGIAGCSCRLLLDNNRAPAVRLWHD